jgi:hypothetical protein
MNALRRSLVCLALLLCGAPLFAKQDNATPRERWERMTPEERAKMQDRFERFRKLGPEQREMLIQRAARIEKLKSEFFAHMDPELRAKLGRLEPRERREVLREYIEQRLIERGRHMGELLPPKLRRELENARPEERPRMMREFLEQQRRERSQRMLERAAEKLDLDASEVERIKALPDEQRFEAMLDLQRKLVTRAFEEHGLPKWISSDEWSAMQKLPLREFFERFRELRREHAPDSGHGAGFREHFGDHHVALPPDVRDALRPDPAWWVELSKLPRDERRAAIEARIHDRLLERLAAHGELASPEEIESLRAKQGRAFLEAFHSLMAEKSAAQRSSDR